MPESIVLRQSTLNPYRSLMRRRLANHLANRVNSGLASIINGIEHAAATPNYKPVGSKLTGRDIPRPPGQTTQLLNEANRPLFRLFSAPNAPFQYVLACSCAKLQAAARH